jgi:hypothetical protein
MEISKNMTERELGQLREAVVTLPSISNIFYLCKGLALNGHREEASLWQSRTDRIFDEKILRIPKKDWSEQAKRTPEMAGLPWAGTHP